MMSAAVKGKSRRRGPPADPRVQGADVDPRVEARGRVRRRATCAAELDGVAPRRPRGAAGRREVPGAHQVRHAGVEHPPAGPRRDRRQLETPPAGLGPRNRGNPVIGPSDGELPGNGHETQVLQERNREPSRLHDHRRTCHGPGRNSSRWSTKRSERFRGRDLVAGAEVLDFLLDLRTAVARGRVRSSNCSRRARAPSTRHGYTVGRTGPVARRPPMCRTPPSRIEQRRAPNPAPSHHRARRSRRPARGRRGRGLGFVDGRRRLRRCRRATADHVDPEARAPRLSDVARGHAVAARATTKGWRASPVYASPDAAARLPVSTLSPETEYTAAARASLAFEPVPRTRLHVYLPTRPNDATGWINGGRRLGGAAARVPDHGQPRRAQGHAPATTAAVAARGIPTAIRHRRERRTADRYLLLHRPARRSRPHPGIRRTARVRASATVSGRYSNTLSDGSPVRRRSDRHPRAPTTPAPSAEKRWRTGASRRRPPTT